MSAAERAGRKLKLARAERALLAVLLQQERVTRADFTAALVALGSKSNNLYNLLNVRLCELRSALARFGAPMERVFEDGAILVNGQTRGRVKIEYYSLSEASRAKLLALAGPDILPKGEVIKAEWGLTGAEAAVLAPLLSGKVITRLTAFEALRQAGFKASDDVIVKVHICRIKPKLAPFGLYIAGIWGRGYQLTRGEAPAALGAPAL